MIRRIVIPLLLTTLCLAPPLLAQDVAVKSEATENAALDAESRGLYENALDGFQMAFTQAVSEAGQADSAEGKQKALARAEFYLEKIGWLTGETSKYRETGKFLAGVDPKAVGANLGAWVDWYHARSLVAEGKVDQARALLGDLGFLTDFWIVGSFDNERGAGFDHVYPPEKKIDLGEQMKGKDRQVGWRRASFQPIFGYFDLDGQFRPNDQCLAYAAAWFTCPDDRTAEVRVGSDEAVKVWVNGSLVIAHDVSRTCGLDQDAGTVRLRAGTNRVLLKVGDQTGPWGFRLRFTTPDGTPMKDLTITNSRSQVAKGEAELAGYTPPTRPDLAVTRGALDIYERLDKAGRATAQDLFHLGYLHYRRDDQDRHDRVAMKILERAATLAPKNPFIQYAIALSAERKVGSEVDREENDRRRAMEKAIHLDRNYAQAYYLLAHYYTYTLPVYDKAEANLRRALAVNPLFLDARLLEIDLLRKRGYPVEADARLAQLMKVPQFAGYTPFLVRKADYAASRHEVDGEKKALDGALARDYADGAARGRLIEMLKDVAKPEKALPLYDEKLVLNPYDVATLSKKALLLEGLGRFEDAAAAALAALRICPDDDGILDQVGRIYYKLEDRDKALTFWKEALAANPKLAHLRRYVEFIDPASRPYEDAFPVDLAPLLAKARAYEDTENDPWIDVLDQEIDKVNPDGTSSSFVRKVVKILNDQGVKQFDTYGVRYSPSEQAIHWKVFKVIHPDGSSEDGRVIRGQYVDLPRLSAGDVVDLEWRIDDLKQSFFGDYFGQTFYFGDWVPTLDAEYVVIAPEDKDLYFHTRNLDLDPAVSAGPGGKTKIFTFHPESVPKIHYEPNMPSPREVFPQVQVSNYKNWDDFARWYWHLIRNQFQTNDEMNAKVAELVKGKKTRFEKIRAIYDFVVTDIRYDSSWEFGVHGYKPYDATAIYARKFGDCKDKAILTTTLLRQIGVTAYPVLIHAAQGARSDEDLALPQVGHFNHCITYVPDVDGKGDPMFLDGTAQYHSILAMPGMDRGAKVLVVEPDGCQRIDIPWNDPAKNGESEHYDATLGADGSAAMKADLTFRGDLAPQIRYAFAVKAMRPIILNKLLGRLFGDATLEDSKFSDLTDLSVADTDVKIDFDVPKFAEKTDRGLEIRVAYSPMNLSSLASSNTRKWDIVLGPPNTTSVSADVHLPAGYKVVSRPKDVKIDNDWGSFTFTIEVAKGVVHFHRTLVFKTHRIPKSEYDHFRAFAAAVDLAAKEKVIIAPE